MVWVLYFDLRELAYRRAESVLGASGCRNEVPSIRLYYDYELPVYPFIAVLFLHYSWDTQFLVFNILESLLCAGA